MDARRTDVLRAGPLAACLGVGGLLAAVAVGAADRPYAEVGYGWLTLASSGSDVTVGDAIGRMGFPLTDSLAAEVFGATSAASGYAYDVSFKVDNVYGGYLKLHTETAPDFQLFAKAGWVHSTVRAAYYGYGPGYGPGYGSGYAYDVSTSDSSFSYGVGMQYLFTDTLYMQGDYFVYYDKYGDTIKGPSLSIGMRF
jgi:hypothetical protein